MDATEEAIRKVAQHVGVELDSYLVELFSKVSREALDRIVSNPTAGSAPAQEKEESSAPKEEEPKEEEEDQASSDFDLF